MGRGAAFVLGVLAVTSGGALGAPPPGGPDVVRYDLEVAIREKDLLETVTIRAEGLVPSEWSLDLVPEMKVLSAEAGGKAVPCGVSGSGVLLHVAGGAGADGGSFAVTLRLEGSPREENRSMGFVRSAVAPGLVHIRSQVPWYPRVPDDPAIVRTVVDAPANLQVRAAGSFAPPEAKGDRALWTFETKDPVDRAGLAAGAWKSLERPRGGVLFDALYTAGHEKGAEALLAAAGAAFEFYGKRLGPLPWKRLTLVEMPKEFGPSSGYCEEGYILLGPDPFEPAGAAAWVPQGIAHEVAHAWWGHAVPVSDFASESLAEFSSLLALREAKGEEAARGMREAAVVRVAAAAAAGREAAFADIRGGGSGMDPGTYRVHAYEKGMMLLSMVEESVGREGMGKLLSRFFAEHRGKRAGWTDLRAALAAAGSEVRTILDQWEVPGIPTLTVEFTAKKAGSSWAVSGRLVQTGTKTPFRMEVPVAADGGGKRVATTVRMKGAEASFTLKTPAEPIAVTVDPDWLLLADRRGAGAADPAKAYEEALVVVNDPGEADPGKLEEAMGKLRAVLAAGQNQGACHVGIGRCLFRLGKLDEAREELEAGLRIGGFGPFFRSWAQLRLGCIADLGKKREEAVSRYEAVLALPDAGNLKFQKGRARAFLERPYRGYAVDK